MATQIPTDLDFLAAYIHGRRSRIAEGPRLDELAGLRSVPELARALISDTPPVTAAELQRRLILEQAAEMSLIASKLGGAAGDYLAWLRVRFQVENLKVLARGFAGGMSSEELQPYLVPLPDDLAVDAKALASADSIEAFAALLPNKTLASGLEAVIPLYQATPRPFFAESGLDKAYLRELIRRAGQVPSDGRAAVAPLARQEADTFHLMLAARGRFTYDLKADQIEPLHVSGGLIQTDAFRQMLRADTLEEVARLAKGRAIDRVPGGEGAEPTPPTLERAAWERYYRVATWSFRRSHMGLGAVVAFVAFRRIELANLIRLSEGIRSGVAPGEIRRWLIPRREREG